MNSTSLEEAILWMAESMGLDPVRDRDEVVNFVNKYRNLLYNSFNRIQLFDDYEQCFRINTFRQDCHGHGCSTYRGFTATLDMGGIMGAWESLSEITLRSRWREVHRGKNETRGNEVEIVPVNGTFPTEREMTGFQKLRLYACSKSDKGKTVVITVINKDGAEMTLRYVLGDDVQVTVNRKVRSVVSVTLPAGLCGNVELSQEDGSILSIYPPGVRTPSYRRYKVKDDYTCSSGTILIQSARTFVPVTEDHEVIEVGDQLVVEAAAKYFKYGDNTLEARERKAALSYLSDMYFYLDNIKERDRGRETQDTSVNYTKKPRKATRRGLPGYKKRRRR